MKRYQNMPIKAIKFVSLCVRIKRFSLRREWGLMIWPSMPSLDLPKQLIGLSGWVLGGSPTRWGR